VRAFTLWAAFGSFDWDSLVTRNRGHYEPGVFDVRSREPRCTAIGKWIKSIMRCEAEHPLLETEGWWNRPERLQHAFSVLDSGKVIPRVCHQHVYASLAAPIVLISGDSSIGHAFARVCQSRRIQFVTASDNDREFSANDQLVDAIKTSRPWAVIDTRMYEGTAPEIKGDESIRNCTDSLIAAGLCEKIGIPFVSLCPALKSDRGTQTGYTESDDGNAVPIEAFNTTSVEERLSKANPSALIVRTASLFSPWDLTNFLTAALRRLSNGEPVTARSDSVISPTYVPDVVNVTLDLLIDDEQGIWHLSNKGAATPFDFIKTTACRRGVSTDSLVPVRGRTRAGLREDARSSKEQIHLMPNLDDAIERFVNECECLPQSLTCTSVD
jgi:dTDP-4-dehydrorhamnose reductase